MQHVIIFLSLSLWVSISPFGSLPRQAGGADDFVVLGVERARTRAVAALDEADALLETQPASHRAEWKTFLRWQVLRDELARENPDPSGLAAAACRFQQNVAGLELPPMVAARETLSDYLRVLLAANDFAAQPVPTDATDLLRVRMAALESDPSDANAVTLGRILGWLQATGQDVDGTVNAARDRCSHPNLHVQVSAALLRDLLATAVDKRTDVREVVFGATIQGSAHTQAKISTRLPFQADRAAIDLHMVGHIDAPSLVGQQRRVSIYSSSRTTVDAFKRIYIDDDGLHSGEVKAHCTTATQYHDVVANRRLIERLAWRRLGQVQAAAQAIASQRAEKRIERELDDEAATRIERANHVYAERFQLPATRMGLLPEKIALSTTPTHLSIAARACKAFQIGAPVRPSPLDPRHDLALQVHSSLIGNICEAALAGKTMRDRELLDFVKLLTGEAPRALWVHDNAPRWSLTLPVERPIIVKFDRNQFEIVWRVARATRGEEELDAPFEVTALYDLVSTATGPQFVRRGDLALRFSSLRIATSRQADFEAFLLRKFNAILQPQWTFDGLEPPSGGTWGKLRRMSHKQFSTQAGWFVLAYQKLPAELDGAPSDKAAQRVAQRTR